MPWCLCGGSVFHARPGLRGVALPSQLSIEDPDPVGTVNSGLSSCPSFDSALFPAYSAVEGSHAALSRAPTFIRWGQVAAHGQGKFWRASEARTGIARSLR